jgi:acetolactate synthase-1/2/3 large subunit
MPTVADVIIDALRDAGVRALFGVPGGAANLDLIASAGRAGMPFVLTATETAGAIAAQAQAEVTGRPGACLTTLGPGAASVVNGVASAFLDRAPLVVFTDSHAAAAPFEHQQLDHRALLAPVTVSSATLTVDHVRETMARTLAAAIGPRPGPAHLDCPGDVAATVVGGGFQPAPRHAGPKSGPYEPPSAPPPDLSAIEPLIARAKRPIVIVGLGARRAEDARAIRALCERRHIPALVTYKAKGVVADDDAWFAGVFANSRIERPMVDDSDLVIGLGLDPVELLPRPWTIAQPAIYCGPWAVDPSHVPWQGQVVAGAAACAAAIESLLPLSEWDAGFVRGRVDEQRARILLPADGLTAQRVVQVAGSRLASTAARVTVDAGAHMFPATMLWPAREPNDMLISNGLSTMGFALPAAVGAALLDRRSLVVALTGDGGLLMCLGELLTAARERLTIMTIVFSDATLSLIEIKQQHRQLQPSGVALGAIDWPRLAGSFGVPAFAAATEDELSRAIDQALACDGPSLVEARIDRSNYGATMRAIRG